MGSWKAKLFGILTLVLAPIAAYLKIKGYDAEATLLLALIPAIPGIGLLFVRDDKVTSRESGAAEAAAKRATKARIKALGEIAGRPNPFADEADD